MEALAIATETQKPRPRRPRPAAPIRLHRAAPEDHEIPGARLEEKWAGHELVIHTWTSEEWKSLDSKPTDARRARNGVRVALRIA